MRLRTTARPVGGQITGYSEVCSATGSQRRLSDAPKAIGPA